MGTELNRETCVPASFAGLKAADAGELNPRRLVVLVQHRHIAARQAAVGRVAAGRATHFDCVRLRAVELFVVHAGDGDDLRRVPVRGCEGDAGGDAVPSPSSLLSSEKVTLAVGGAFSAIRKVASPPSSLVVSPAPKSSVTPAVSSSMLVSGTRRRSGRRSPRRCSRRRRARSNLLVAVLLGVVDAVDRHDLRGVPVLWREQQERRVAVPSPSSSLSTAIRTSAVGAAFKTTLKVACPPASLVVRSASASTVIPADSSSVLVSSTASPSRSS